MLVGGAIVRPSGSRRGQYVSGAVPGGGSMQTALLANVTFLDVIAWMIAFFFLCLAIWIFIAVVADIFRRSDIGGVAKGLWLLAVFILPLLGCVVYLVARPVTARDREMMDEYRSGRWRSAGLSPADEIDKAHELQQKGAISEEEYEMMKRTALGSL